MINYSNLIPIAKSLSQHCHRNQKYGEKDYYSYHIQGVVDSLTLHNLPEEYLIIAYLHDSVEDSNITLQTIKETFGTLIATAVESLTKQNSETREKYLTRCAKNEYARIVKLHDAMFNATNCFKDKNKAKYNYYIETIANLNSL